MGLFVAPLIFLPRATARVAPTPKHDLNIYICLISDQSNDSPQLGQVASLAATIAPQRGQLNVNCAWQTGQATASSFTADPHSGHTDCPQAGQASAPLGS
jgi:hypothetical protein